MVASPRERIPEDKTKREDSKIPSTLPLCLAHESTFVEQKENRSKDTVSYRKYKLPPKKEICRTKFKLSAKTPKVTETLPEI